ncbi:MAG: hypothetical protein M3444_04615 [Acidobacteriota bacterium]|nr:hypothetical protein [Acidobacteriota bacterium]
MSNSRFVLKQVHVRGTGASDLVRYVAKSKLHEGREGKMARPLFTDWADNLTISEAQKWLTVTGGALRKDDILHYVLSFSDKREFGLLGDDRDECRSEIARYMRGSLAAGFKEIGIGEIRWMAGLHLNADNPHIHLLLNKNAILRERQDLVRLSRLPNPLLPHNALRPDGTRAFSNGTIINTFAALVDARHRDRVRFIQYKNRLRGVEFTRALLAPNTLGKRPPTDEERLVGRWVVEEIEAARGPKNLRMKALSEHSSAAEKTRPTQGDELSRHSLAALRSEVARLDRASSQKGEPPLAAFIETETLRGIITAPPRGMTTAPRELDLLFEKVLAHDSTRHLERSEHSGRTAPDRLTAAHNTPAKEPSRAISPPVRSR